MIISIHQSNFLPRFSFFQKIEQSDLFIFLGHCKYSSSAFQNRFNLNNKMYNMVVSNEGTLIIEKKYKNVFRDWQKIENEFPKLKTFNHCLSENLYEMNTRIIFKACAMLDIPTQKLHDYPTELTGTERLVDICKHYGATKYLSGISGKNYLDLSLFEKAEIEVVFQDEAKMDKRPFIELIQ